MLNNKVNKNKSIHFWHRTSSACLLNKLCQDPTPPLFFFHADIPRRVGVCLMDFQPFPHTTAEGHWQLPQVCVGRCCETGSSAWSHSPRPCHLSDNRTPATPLRAHNGLERRSSAGSLSRDSQLRSIARNHNFYVVQLCCPAVLPTGPDTQPFSFPFPPLLRDRMGLEQEILGLPFKNHRYYSTQMRRVLSSQTRKEVTVTVNPPPKRFMPLQMQTI